MDKLNDDGFEKLIKSVIGSCKWRKDFCGVDICRGMCLPCTKVIDRGECSALKEFFEKGNN